MPRRQFPLLLVSLLALALGSAAAHAQSIPITSIVTTLNDSDGALTTTINGKAGANPGSMTFQNATRSITSFSTATTTFNVASLADAAYIRRNSVSVAQSSIWYANATSPTTERQGAYVTNYQGGSGSILLANDLTRGSDNTFVNGASGAASGNIERLDFVFTGGLTVSPGLAFTVMDRGVAGAHDAFKIAVITGWDPIGEVPTSYGTLVSQAANWGSTNSVADFGYTLLRYSAGDNGGNANNLTTYNAGNETGTQGIAGMLFTGAALGLTNGDKIYGYSLFAGDVTGSGSQLIGFTNSTYFPTNTADINGGIDLASVNGLALQDIAFSAVPEPGTYALAAVAVMAAGAVVHRRRRTVR
jgi:hypothetical protein